MSPVWPAALEPMASEPKEDISGCAVQVVPRALPTISLFQAGDEQEHKRPAETNSQVQPCWHRPVIPTAQEAEAEGSWV